MENIIKSINLIDVSPHSKSPKNTKTCYHAIYNIYRQFTISNLQQTFTRYNYPDRISTLHIAYVADHSMTMISHYYL